MVVFVFAVRFKQLKNNKKGILSFFSFRFVNMGLVFFFFCFFVFNDFFVWVGLSDDWALTPATYPNFK